MNLSEIEIRETIETDRLTQSRPMRRTSDPAPSPTSSRYHMWTGWV